MSLLSADWLANKTSVDGALGNYHPFTQYNGYYEWKYVVLLYPINISWLLGMGYLFYAIYIYNYFESKFK